MQLALNLYFDDADVVWNALLQNSRRLIFKNNYLQKVNLVNVSFVRR